MNIAYYRNNLDWMRTLPDKYAHLAFADPPYGIDVTKPLAKSGKGLTWMETKEYKKWDNEPPPPEYWKELFRVSENQIVFGANYFIVYLKNTRGMVCWRKNNGGSFFADFELIWISHATVNREFEYHSSTRTKKDGKRFHHTQKPIDLYKWLLSKYAKPGQKIIDTHIGSGSIRLACHDLGFDFEGCEIDKDYFDAQEKRYQEHIAIYKDFSQNDLFGKKEICEQIFEGNLFE